MAIQDELKMSRPPGVGLELVLSLLLTREALSGVFDAQLFGPFGITDQQFNVLRILRGGPPEGYTLAELKRRLLHRNADAVRLVERMVRAGWVERMPHPEDRRASLVRLTEEGVALHAGMEGPHQALCARVGALLESEALRTLCGHLDTLRSGLREGVAPEDATALPGEA